MKLLRESERIATPWKNGGGVTFELAAHPAGSDLSTFDWRVSTAIVATDGAFSTFVQIDRTLVLISGAGIRLSIGGAETTLTNSSDPLQFPGDADCYADLLSDPIVDLNVMVRRGRWASKVSRHELPWTEAGRSPGTRLFVVLSEAAARGSFGEVELRPLDALMLESQEDVVIHSERPGASLVKVELTFLMKSDRAEVERRPSPRV
jgi:environmental stress-induced protein Ves